MPPPASFYTITSFPYSQLVDDVDFNAGTYGNSVNDVWFFHVATQDGVLGNFVTDATINPQVTFYETDALTTIQSSGDQAAWARMYAGRNYWIQIRNFALASASGDFTVSFDRAELNPPVARGQIIINGDSSGEPATLLRLDGTVVGFLTAPPSGEIGHGLPDGTTLWHDRYARYGAGNALSIFDPDLNRVLSFDTSPSLGSDFPRINNNGINFYLSDDTGRVHSITPGGQASGIIATLGTTPNAIAVDPDATILYYASGSTIKRWDLVSDVALSDLYTAPGTIAVTQNNHPGDLLYLADGTLVTFYAVGGVFGTYTLVHLDQHGTVLHSYGYNPPIAINHLAYAADNPDAVTLWLFLNNGGDSGRFQHLRLSDGVADVTFDTDHFSGGANQTAGSDTMFGPSNSCTAVLLGYNSSANPCCNAGYGGPTQGPTGEPSLTPNETPPAPTPSTSPGTCCGSSGPGGSPPSTGYGPPGGPAGTTPTPTTPRIVPVGGAAPSYTACSGGGVPNTASDPVNAQDLTTCTTPLVHLKWSLPDASVRRYGTRAFTSGNGQAVAARVLKWGAVSQTLSDRYGSFQASSFTVKLSDYDRTIRALLSAASTKYIDGKEVEILVETAANAALSVTPLVLARGIVTSWKYHPDLTFDLTVTDPLGYRFSSVSLDRPLPQALIGSVFDDAAEQNQNRPLPIIYGDESDDYTWSLEHSRVPVGIVPVIHLGKANAISASGVPGSQWEAFLIAGHAIAGIQSVFASNLDPAGEGSVRMSTATYGVDFLVPGEDCAKYFDVTGSNGTTYRVALLFARGPRADAHIKGRVPITVNACGIEDVGDGSGDVITNIAYQRQHFLSNFVVGNWTSGAWLAVPAFGDGTGKVRTSSFATCRTTQIARIGGDGYQGALYIGTQKPAREWDREFGESGDMRLGVNNHGQLLAMTVDDQASTSGLTTFTATAHVLGGSFEIEPKGDEIFNVYTYEYGPETATSRNAGKARTIKNATSITNHGERLAQARVYQATRHKPTADDVANRTMLRSADAPTNVQFKLDLRGTELQIGELIKVTSYLGIGSTGWTNRVLLVVGIQTNPDEDEFSTVIACEDVGDFVGGSYLALDGAFGLDVAMVA